MHQLNGEDLETGYPFPSFYNRDCLVLMLRDPYWIYAYWELTGSLLNYYRKKYHSRGWDDSISLLRVYRFPPGVGELESPEGTFDIELDPWANNWYIPAGVPHRTYQVELGRQLPRGGEFIPLLRSNPVTTPRVSASDIVDAKWRPFPLQQKIYRRMALHHLSSLELQARGTDREELFSSRDWITAPG